MQGYVFIQYQSKSCVAAAFLLSLPQALCPFPWVLAWPSNFYCGPFLSTHHTQKWGISCLKVKISPLSDKINIDLDMCMDLWNEILWCFCSASNWLRILESAWWCGECALSWQVPRMVSGSRGGCRYQQGDEISITYPSADPYTWPGREVPLSCSVNEYAGILKGFLPWGCFRRIKILLELFWALVQTVKG